jgi:hypothetical protein
MTRLSLRTVGAACVVVSVVALPAVTIAQQEAADDAFRQGLDARGDKKWPAAVDAMRRAIKIDPKESTRRISSGIGRLIPGRGTEYFPYYFLGEALKERGDCAGAVTALETSEAQKTVLGNQEFRANLYSWYKDCAARGILLRADYLQQLALTDKDYREAYDVAARVSKIRSSNPDLSRADIDADFARVQKELEEAYSRRLKGETSRLSADFTESRNATARATQLLKPLEARLNAAVTNIAAVQGQSKEVRNIIQTAEDADRAIDATKVTLTPELAASRDSARQTLTRARERLSTAEKNQSAASATEAQAFAKSASEALSKVLEATRKLVGEQLQLAVATAEQEFSFLDTSFGRLNQLFAERPQMVQPGMTAQRDVLQKDLTAARRQFESSRKSANIQGVQEATRLISEARMRLDALLTIFVPLTLRDRGVVAALEDGARYYLDGQYQKALEALGPPGQLTNVLLQVHVHVFRAASLYALYLSSGQSNQGLREQAAAEVQRSKEIDPAFQPSRRAFTPRFISFYETGAVPATSSPAAPAPAQ